LIGTTEGSGSRKRQTGGEGKMRISQNERIARGHRLERPQVRERTGEIIVAYDGARRGDLLPTTGAPPASSTWPRPGGWPVR